MDCSPPGSSAPMELSRQEYWSGLPFPPPGDLPDPGIELSSPVSPNSMVGLNPSEWRPYRKTAIRLNPHLLHQQADSLPLHHLESPFVSSPTLKYIRNHFHVPLSSLPLPLPQAVGKPSCHVLILVGIFVTLQTWLLPLLVHAWLGMVVWCTWACGEVLSISQPLCVTGHMRQLCQ